MLYIKETERKPSFGGCVIERWKRKMIRKMSPTIFHSGSMLIATFINSLSRKGTRASTPHAEVDLLALKQSYWWRALICKQIRTQTRFRGYKRQSSPIISGLKALPFGMFPREIPSCWVLYGSINILQRFHQSLPQKEPSLHQAIWFFST